MLGLESEGTGEELMRVAEFLGEKMDGSQNRRKRRDLVISLPPSSASASSTNTPRSLLRSLVKLPRYCIMKEKKGEEEREGEEVVGPTVMEVAAAETGGGESALMEEGGAGSGKSSAEVLLSSGRKPETVSFNLGIGVGLVFLLVKSATEFNKMIELRRQMEILVKDIKGEIQRKNVTSSFSESNNYTVLSASNCWGDESTSNPISLQNDRVPYHIVGAHTGMEFNRQSKCETTLEKKRCLKMNQLEEELEVELERLQINMEGEDSSVLPQQHNMELGSENTDHSESFSPSFGEVGNEPGQEETSEHCGVCPHELERRLHELLESRQQERIAELESALECVERKLQEKETEICWWQDTARLVSKHREVTLFR